MSARAYAASAVTVKVTLERIRALDGFEGIGGAADFYGCVKIAGIEHSNEDTPDHDALEDMDDISPTWEFSNREIDSSIGTFPIEIDIRDEDGGFRLGDDQADIKTRRWPDARVQRSYNRSPKFTAKERAELIGPHFDPKIKHCACEAVITQSELDFTRIAHVFRNEAYHAGLVHDDIIWDIAWTYHEVACKLGVAMLGASPRRRFAVAVTRAAAVALARWPAMLAAVPLRISSATSTAIT